MTLAPDPQVVGYWLGRTDQTLDPLYLPLTATLSPTGTDRAYTLDRPPGSEQMFLLGDGQRDTKPLTLTFTVYMQTVAEVRAYRKRLDLLARTADALGFEGVTRALLGGGWATWATADARHLTWTCTLTLLPSGPDGLDADGNPTPF